MTGGLPRRVADLVDRLPWPVVLVLAILATRAAALFLPFFSGDEATYSALASKVLAGGLPYVGAVDHKPVGVELTYAAVYAVFGRNRLIFVRLLLFAFVALTGVVLSRIGERLRGDRSGRVAGLAYVVASAWGLPGDMQAANTELFLDLPLAMAAWAILPTLLGDRRGDGWRMLAAGVLTALATTYKYQAAIAGLAWAISAGVAPGTLLQRFRRLVLLAAGFGGAAAAYLGFFALTGTFDAFLFWGWGFNFSYMGALPADLVAWNASYYTLLAAAFWMPLLVLVQVPRGATAWLALPWLAVMLGSVTAGGRYFPHYYLMALPPLSLLVSCGASPPARWRRTVAVGAGVLLTVACVVLSFAWYRVKPNLQAFTDAYRAVAAFIDERSGPDDRILVWGNSPEIYYLSDRVMGTRFPFCNYHTGKIWGSPQAEKGATGTEALIVPRAWAELLADLDAAPPRFVVDGGAGNLDLFDGHPVDRYPDLAKRVRDRYRLAGSPAGVPVYQRVDGVPAAPASTPANAPAP